MQPLRCPRCHRATSDPLAAFCRACGAPLRLVEEPAPPPLTAPVDLDRRGGAEVDLDRTRAGAVPAPLRPEPAPPGAAAAATRDPLADLERSHWDLGRPAAARPEPSLPAPVHPGPRAAPPRGGAPAPAAPAPAAPAPPQRAPLISAAPPAPRAAAPAAGPAPRASVPAASSGGAAPRAPAPPAPPAPPSGPAPHAAASSASTAAAAPRPAPAPRPIAPSATAAAPPAPAAAPPSAAPAPTIGAAPGRGRPREPAAARADPAAGFVEIHVRRAEPWRRASAWAIDALPFVAGAVVLVRFFVRAATVGAAAGEGGVDLLDLVARERVIVLSVAAAMVLAHAVYATLAHALAGATLGKRLLRLRVVGPLGERPTLARSAGRSALAIASVAALGLGLLLALFTARGRALHDLVARTWVVDAQP